MGFTRQPLLALLGAGFAIWAAGFVIVYAVLSFGCASGWDSVHLGPVSVQRATLVALAVITALATMLLAALLWTRPSRTDDQGPLEFIRTTAFNLALAAIGAVMFTFSGVATLSTCS